MMQGKKRILTKPNTNKSVETFSSSQLNGVSIEMQGWRASMEDSKICCTDLGDGNALFAVFDGHNGREISTFLSRNLGNSLKKSEKYQAKKYKEALRNVFVQLDQLLSTQKGEKQLSLIRKQFLSCWDYIFKKISQQSIGKVSGSTANVILITPTHYYVANAGDSRSVLVRDNMSIDLSHDHKPENKEEKERIIKAGGTVSKGRINGVINVSRGFGDFQFKNNKNVAPLEQMMICLPQIAVVKRDFDEDKYIMMGCDGVWECSGKSSTNIMNAFNKKMKNFSPEAALKQLFEENMGSKESIGKQGFDNMTAIFIQFTTCKSTLKSTEATLKTISEKKQ